MIAPTYAELRRLLAEASPGEWHASMTGHSVRDHAGCIICDTRKVDGRIDWMVANGALIAAMRNALPALLTEAEAGRKLRGRMDSIHAGHVWSSRETAKFALAEYDAAVAKGGAE